MGKELVLLLILMGCSLSMANQDVEFRQIYSKIAGLSTLDNQQIIQKALGGLFEKLESGGDFLEQSFEFLSLPSLTNKEILQQALNGIFEQNFLPDSTTIIPCIDENSAQKIVKFIGASLQKLAKGSISDLANFINELKLFPNQLPQQVKDCLVGNQELSGLGSIYGIYTTEIDPIEKAFLSYLTNHYLSFHRLIGNLNIQWKAGKYTQAGFDFAQYAHNIWMPHATNSQLSHAANLRKNQIPQPLDVLSKEIKLALQNGEKIVNLA